jgi:malate dehydrogenase (oxaloacetate-decarboxylating)(NADP+)
MICGLVGRFESHLQNVQEIVGTKADVTVLATLNALMLPTQTLFVADTFVNEDPSAEELAEIAAMAVQTVRRFGVPPKVAFVSHSMFGSSERASARKMRAARQLFAARMPGVECDGDMRGDAALSEEIRRTYLPQTTLAGAANLLIMPNLDSANILFNVLKETGGRGITIGPMLLGAARPIHVLEPSSTVRRIVNMTAIAAVEAAMEK